MLSDQDFNPVTKDDITVIILLPHECFDAVEDGPI